MTPAQAWEHICDCYYDYHNKLKFFNCSYDRFIPEGMDFINEMYQVFRPIKELEEKYRDKFFSAYDEKRLHNSDKVLESDARPALERVEKTLAPFVKKWGLKIPNDIVIYVTYGYGAGYDYDSNYILLRGTRTHDARIPKTLQHELVHLIIEKPIIQKYNVPQDLKERIVDIICYEYFGKEPQPQYLNSFANKYITRTAIENDLPGAVKKMMDDFTAMRQKIANTKSNG